MKDENEGLKAQVDGLNQRLDKTLNLDLAAHVEDKNFLSTMMIQKDQEIQKLMAQLREETSKNQKLVLQVKSQEVEVRTLLNCVENLRKQVIRGQKVEGTSKYKKYDQVLELYQDSEQMIEKIKKERTVEVQKDVFDLAMKKISTQAEIEMIEIELKQIMDEYGKDVDLNEIGLEI